MSKEGLQDTNLIKEDCNKFSTLSLSSVLVILLFYQYENLRIEDRILSMTSEQ